MDTVRPSEEEILAHLEAKLQYRFKDAKIAVQALTHSSAKDKDFPCNERLEFLGDAILGHVISEHLFHHFPGYEEGELSTMKSIIVSAKTLSEKARELELDRIIILGRGLTEKRQLPRSILCNAFEAVGGFDETLYAAEEIALCRALGERGRFVVLRETVLTSGRKLRTYSAGELLRAMIRVLLAGRAGLADRSRLDIWYGPRRPDRGGTP